MKVNHLRLDCDESGDNTVHIWAECFNPNDLEDVIAWLQLARTFTVAWKRRREAKKAPVVKLERAKS